MLDNWAVMHVIKKEVAERGGSDQPAENLLKEPRGE